MSALVQKQTCAPHNVTSAITPIATEKADFRKRSCPLYPQKRTCAVQLGMSAMANSGHPPSFDHFVSGYQQTGRHTQTKGLRSFEVNGCFELCRRLHRQFGGLVAAQDAIDIECCQPKQSVLIGPVRHKTASRNEKMGGIHSRQPMPGRE